VTADEPRDLDAEEDEVVEDLWDAEPCDPFDPYERQDDGWGWP
jgi:hypothetical protein